MTDKSSPAEDESMVVFEFAVPNEAFILTDALREHIGVVVEIGRLVPTTPTPSPCLWTRDRQSLPFETAISDERGIERVLRMLIGKIRK